MIIKQVQLSEIANNPELSLSARDYIKKPEQNIVCAAPRNWRVLQDCHKPGCEYCLEIRTATERKVFATKAEADKFLKNLSSSGFRVPITEDEYHFIKQKI